MPGSITQHSICTKVTKGVSHIFHLAAVVSVVESESSQKNVNALIFLELKHCIVQQLRIMLNILYLHHQQRYMDRQISKHTKKWSLILNQSMQQVRSTASTLGILLHKKPASVLQTYVTLMSMDHDNQIAEL